MSDLDNFKKRVTETINDTEPARVAGDELTDNTQELSEILDEFLTDIYMNNEHFAANQEALDKTKEEPMQAILDWHNKQVEAVLDRLSEQIKDNLTPDDLHLYVGGDRYNIYSKIEREYDSPDDTPDWENVELRVLLNGLREEVVGSIEAERKKLDRYE